MQSHSLCCAPSWCSTASLAYSVAAPQAMLQLLLLPILHCNKLPPGTLDSISAIIPVIQSKTVQSNSPEPNIHLSSILNSSTKPFQLQQIKHHLTATLLTSSVLQHSINSNKPISAAIASTTNTSSSSSQTTPDFNSAAILKYLLWQQHCNNP